MKRHQQLADYRMNIMRNQECFRQQMFRILTIYLITSSKTNARIKTHTPLRADKTNKQTNKKTNKQTNKQINKHTFSLSSHKRFGSNLNVWQSAPSQGKERVLQWLSWLLADKQVQRPHMELDDVEDCMLGICDEIKWVRRGSIYKKRSLRFELSSTTFDNN